MKILFFDVETTGLDPKRQDIIQLAILVEIDGKVVEERDIRMQPFDYETVQKEALEVNNTTVKELKTYQTPQDAFKELIGLLQKYVNRYDKNDKFFPAGYNVRFDLDFLTEFFEKNNDLYFGSWFNYKGLDPLPLLYLLDAKGIIKFSNYKLEEVCRRLNISVKAHDALSDIKATRQVFKRLFNKICLEQ